MYTWKTFLIVHGYKKNSDKTHLCKIYHTTDFPKFHAQTRRAAYLGSNFYMFVQVYTALRFRRQYFSYLYIFAFIATTL
jgi:hypothetical protein